MAELLWPGGFVTADENSAESEPSTSKEWLGLALESARMCAYKWDLTTNIIYRSKLSSLYSRIHTSSDSWMYHEGLDYVHADDRDFVHQSVQEAIRIHKEFNIEFRVQIPQDDKIRWLQTKGHAVYGDHGVPLYVFAVTQETTQRKEDELRLLHQKKELEILRSQLKITLEAAGMIALSNMQPNQKFKSPELSRLFNIEDENTDLDRAFLHSRVHPEDFERVNKVVDEVISEGGTVDVEYRVPLPKGEVRWLTIKGKHIKDIEGGKGYVVIQDITKRKKIEEQIKEKNEELSLTNKKLDRFSAIVAHDLKSPLTSISLTAELLQRAKSIEEVQGRAESIKALASRMANLIDDVLQFAKADNRKNALKETVAVGSLLEQVKANLDGYMSKTNAVIEVSENLPAVQGSPSQFLQLFQNLISNALKFRSSQAPLVTVSSQEWGDKHLFAVKDNGMGIDLARSPDLFEPFERLQSEVEGTGLGLSICKKIVEAHGGEIWIESEVGCGAQFYFTLPKAP